MSNTTVPANAEGMPKFDRAAVMRLAWEIYRKRFGGEKRDAASRRWAFSLSLKSAWMTVKYEAKEAAKSAEQKRADEIAALRLEVLRIGASATGFLRVVDEHAMASATILSMPEIDHA